MLEQVKHHGHKQPILIIQYTHALMLKIAFVIRYHTSLLPFHKWNLSLSGLRLIKSAAWNEGGVLNCLLWMWWQSVTKRKDLVIRQAANFLLTGNIFIVFIERLRLHHLSIIIQGQLEVSWCTSSSGLPVLKWWTFWITISVMLKVIAISCCPILMCRYFIPCRPYLFSCGVFYLPFVIYFRRSSFYSSFYFILRFSE